ncbi:MAG: ABC transporter permease [Xylophilus ampelinus]
MNPHRPSSISPIAMAGSLWRHREIVMRLSRREIVSKYKGSFLGITWSIFHPLLMLTLYTLVFSVVFKARWGGNIEETKTQFAVTLFAGLMMHGLLAEVLNRAPSLIIGNVSYVKKIVFPIELLPAVAVCAALFHSLINFAVILAAAIFLGIFHWTALLVPLIMLPLSIGALGAGWLIASLSVYLRDVGQIVGILSTMLLFASPVFYPISAIPEAARFWMTINPLTFAIEQTRQVLFEKSVPDFGGLFLYTLGSVVAAWLGYAWFQKTRKGFADVL